MSYPTPDEVARRLREGESKREIAAQFGIRAADITELLWDYVARRYGEVENIRTVAEEVALTPAAVSRILAIRGVEVRRSGRPFKHLDADYPNDAEIRKMYLGKKGQREADMREVAAAFNISIEAVRSSLKRTNTPVRGRGHRRPK